MSPVITMDTPPAPISAAPDTKASASTNAGEVSPAQVSFDGDFDPLMLDPARLMDPTFMPSDEPASSPVSRQKEEEKVKPDEPAASTQPQKEQKEEPASKNEPVNMRKLRELREAAERERDALKLERDALAAKFSELEPKAKSYEAEREVLQRTLAEKEAAYNEARAAAWRSNAREHPEWKARAEDIYKEAAVVEKLLALPEIKEFGIGYTTATLLDSSSSAAVNETVRVLMENGKPLEAKQLMDAHVNVNNLRSQLRGIEGRLAEEAKVWESDRSKAVAGTFMSVRADLASRNPVHDTRSAEFLALPKEQQEFIQAQHLYAEQKASDMLAVASKPEMLAAEAYKTTLAMRLTMEAQKGLQAQVAMQDKELVELRGKLAAYEAAAGGVPAVGAGTGGGTVDENDPAEIARMLDPRNMKGYKGFGV